jgi:hypothetical protein
MEDKIAKDKPFKSKKEYGSIKRSEPCPSEDVAEVRRGLRIRGWINNCINKICGQSG